ncbi:unnamed protein product [Boreogadus saida]
MKTGSIILYLFTYSSAVLLRLLVPKPELHVIIHRISLSPGRRSTETPRENLDLWSSVFCVLPPWVSSEMERKWVHADGDIISARRLSPTVTPGPHPSPRVLRT